jgi:hypothetical protein
MAEGVCTSVVCVCVWRVVCVCVCVMLHVCASVCVCVCRANGWTSFTILIIWNFAKGPRGVCVFVCSLFSSTKGSIVVINPKQSRAQSIKPKVD